MSLLPAKIVNRTGQSLVELALVLPLLVVLILGVIDLSRAIQAHNAIVNMTREGASLASRSLLMVEEDKGSQLIMNSVANTARDLSMSSNGTMYLIKVSGSGGSASITQHYAWNGNRSGPASAVGPGTLAKVLGAITVGNDDTIWIFEIFYKYQSMFAESYAPQLHSVSIFRGGSP